MSNIESLIGKLDYLDVFYLVAWRGTRADERDDEEMQKENYRDSMKAIETAIKLHAKTIIGVGSQAEYGPMFETTNEETAEVLKDYKIKDFISEKCNKFESNSPACKKGQIAYEVVLQSGEKKIINK